MPASPAIGAITLAVAVLVATVSEVQHSFWIILSALPGAAVKHAQHRADRRPGG